MLNLRQEWSRFKQNQWDVKGDENLKTKFHDILRLLAAQLMMDV
jgi:hypothetical protein